ncbi:uncharacterized protein LOC130516739 isoform X2 [Takifugu flavidus]|uniref:uncharacterized protein LOC130516739 isoform X2 n=1 Tax=Takifugu flavidus TaxID=433684 RepID=UPI0025442765|nr:uncharacterized protein LOC130516739 isoform X2 [Takifugu flavidus]
MHEVISISTVTHQGHVAMESPSKFDSITCKELIRGGSPKVYQLKPKSKNIGTLKRMTLGEKDANTKNKTILLLGETGTGKSTLINALVNYAIGVRWEDDVWFEIVEEKQTVSQSESQTSDVIVYEIFGFEGRVLPYSLTIIDTPGYGDTRRVKRDAIIRQRLYDWFRSEDGIHELSAVGLVLKGSENRLSDRLLYIFDSVVSLFGKDVKNNFIALITHSDGITPKNVLNALEDAKIKCAKDEKKQIIHFLFNNYQKEDRSENFEMLKNADNTSLKGLIGFTRFLAGIEPQKLKITTAVLNERIRLEACIKNLKERITFLEMKQSEIHKTREALANYEQEMKKNENFTVEVEKVYKEKKSVDSGLWGLLFYEGATCCTVCEENCHQPGCTIAWYPKHCEVMKRGHCTSCTRMCPVSVHVKENWIYVNKTEKVKMTLQDMKEKYEANKAESESKLSLLEILEKKVKVLEMDKDKMLNESLQHVEALEKIALNVPSLSTVVCLDFLISKLGESKTEMKKKLEVIKSKMDDWTQAALSYKKLVDVENAIEAADFNY